MKKIENGYFIKCLYTSTWSNSHSSNYVLLIDNYGNYTNYSITNVNANSSNFDNIPHNDLRKPIVYEN